MQITTSHVRLIQTGNICVQWSTIEYAFAYTIWHLLGLDEATGKIVTGGLDMLPRANMAINLAVHLKAKPSLAKALTAARKDIQGGLDIGRNTAVHGVHFGTLNNDPVRVEVHRGKGDRKKQESHLADLITLGNEMTALRERLLASLKAHGIYEPAAAPIIAANTLAAAAETVSDPSIGS